MGEANVPPSPGLGFWIEHQARLQTQELPAVNEVAPERTLQFGRWLTRWSRADKRKEVLLCEYDLVSVFQVRANFDSTAIR